MKKMSLVVLALSAFYALAARPARADDGRGPNTFEATNTIEVVRSTFTCQPVTVSSMGATVGVTDLVGSTVPAYVFIEFQNLEATAGIWVGETTTVSTSTTAGIKGAGQRGQKVPAGTAGNPKRFPVPPYKKLYAVCDAASGTCDAEVCKGR
jgi:hypothetical protein